MENLILSLNVVLPLFITMSLGYFLKSLNMFDNNTLDTMNNITFKSFLPMLLFYSIYKTDLQGVFNLKLMIFSATCVIALYLILYLIVPLIEKDNKKRGALLQGLFRSNFVIFGIPITESLFGSEKVGVAALLIAVIVTLFNILSVIALETFRGGKPNFRKISIGIIKNPLIIASCLGILTLLLKIKIPTAMEKTISDVSKIQHMDEKEVNNIIYFVFSSHKWGYNSFYIRFCIGIRISVGIIKVNIHNFQLIIFWKFNIGHSGTVISL